MGKEAIAMNGMHSFTDWAFDAATTTHHMSCYYAQLRTPGIETPAAFARSPSLVTDAFASPAKPADRTAWLRRVAKIVLAVIIIPQVVWVLFTGIAMLHYKVADPPATVLIAYRKLVQGWDIKKITPAYPRMLPSVAYRMLVSVEDSNFYNHHGVDFAAIQQAALVNAKYGRIIKGGSTISMQVARTLFLLPDRNYLRKYFEILTTYEIEAILGKNRILDLYFGYAEWGKGIFGIEAAARYWYGTSVTKLGTDTLAKLIATLSSPIMYSPKTIASSRQLASRYNFLSARYNPPKAAPPEAQSPLADAVPSDIAGAAENGGNVAPDADNFATTGAILNLDNSAPAGTNNSMVSSDAHLAAPNNVSQSGLESQNPIAGNDEVDSSPW